MRQQLRNITPTGNHPFISWCERVMKEVRALKINRVEGGTLRSTPDGVAIIIDRQEATKATSVEIHPYMVVAEYGDYVTGYKTNLTGLTSDSALVSIAKPWRLRQTPWDDRTVNAVTYAYSAVNARTATITGYVEAEVIVPPYFPATNSGEINGDVIYAVKLPASAIGVTDDDGDAVVWQDINTDGRAWAVSSVTVS